MLFAATGLEVTWAGAKGRKVAKVFLADARAVAWDGAAPETNGAVFLPGAETYAYVELKITGRAARDHGPFGHGTKARIRFTGVEDTGEWIEAVVLG
jgi:hypothetical protein